MEAFSKSLQHRRTVTRGRDLTSIVGYRIANFDRSRRNRVRYGSSRKVDVRCRSNLNLLKEFSDIDDGKVFVDVCFDCGLELRQRSTRRLRHRYRIVQCEAVVKLDAMLLIINF